MATGRSGAVMDLFSLWDAGLCELRFLPPEYSVELLSSTRLLPEVAILTTGWSKTNAYLCKARNRDFP